MTLPTNTDKRPRDPFGRPVPTLRRADFGDGQFCEDGDEDGICDAPAHWLMESPALTIALFLCDEHADAERTYHGAVEA